MEKRVRGPLRLAILPLCLGLVSCVIVKAPPETPLPPDRISIHGEEEFTPPGWLDLGVGLGAAFNTTSENDNDVIGVLFNLKGYPLGRWYTHDTEGRIRIIQERSRWFHRASVLYGVSVGELTGSNIRGPIHVVGIGYDVIPHLSIVNGLSLFEEENPGENDTDFAYYFGVSFNLNVLRPLVSGIFGGNDVEDPEIILP